MKKCICGVCQKNKPNALIRCAHIFVCALLFCIFMNLLYPAVLNISVCNADTGGNTLVDIDTDAETQAEHQTSMKLINESSAAYILYDTEKGQQILTKEHTAAADASLLARMMTCLIALENHSLTDKIHAKSTSVSADGNFTITGGVAYTVDSLVSTALIGNSDNAARLLAENTDLSGKSESFIAYMNEKALKMGMNNTYFTSTDGAENTLQKTTVLDTAIFIKNALANSKFKNIYCSPVAVSWDSIIINNPNTLVIENTSSTLGGTFGRFGNTGPNGTVTCFYQKKGDDPLNSVSIILIVSGVNSENFISVQKTLIHEFNISWEKRLYRQKGDIINTIPVGDEKLNLYLGNDIYFYTPVSASEYVENTSFVYLQGKSPDVISPPILAGTDVGAVRYRLKDGTVCEITLYTQNTIITNSTTLNSITAFIYRYYEIFIAILCLLLIVIALAGYKLYWHFTLK